MKSGQSLFSLVLAPAQLRASRGFAASALTGISRSLAKRLAWETADISRGHRAGFLAKYKISVVLRIG